MTIFHRPLAGLLAAMLLIQPVFALGSCCCSELLTETPTAATDAAVPTVAAKCPNCRSFADAKPQRDESRTAHSEGCGCAQHREVLQANRTRHRDTALEVATGVLWVTPLRPARPAAFHAVTPIDNPLPPRIPLQVMLCRWLS